ncbi:MAG: hypothetical protein QNJ62_05065 [Methyloceanibacter sp.]|nr:hypothetical protein [Methyloceanibacter sp.]
MGQPVFQSQNAGLDQRRAAISEIILATVQANWNPPEHLRRDGEMQVRAMGDMEDTILQCLPGSLTVEQLRLYLTKAKRAMLTEFQYSPWPKPAAVAKLVRETFDGFGRERKEPVRDVKEDIAARRNAVLSEPFNPETATPTEILERWKRAASGRDYADMSDGELMERWAVFQRFKREGVSSESDKLRDALEPRLLAAMEGRELSVAQKKGARSQ